MENDADVKVDRLQNVRMNLRKFSFQPFYYTDSFDNYRNAEWPPDTEKLEKKKKKFHT